MLATATPFWWTAPAEPVRVGPVAQALADEWREIWDRYRHRALTLDEVLAKSVTLADLAERLGVKGEYEAARERD